MKSSAHATEVLAQLLVNTRPSWADAVNLYLSLHAGDPGPAGTQLTGEIAYEGYVRVPVPRDTKAWKVADARAENKELIAFAKSSVNGVKLAHAVLGTAQSGAGRVLRRIALATGPVVLMAHQRPEFQPGELTFSER